MKYAIISDIHANLEALTKAMAIIDQRRVDEVICLGDVVGYGANPNECIDLVRRVCSTVVLGNHDEAALDPAGPHDFNPIAQKAIEWTAEQLTTESRTFLSSVPMTEKKESLLFVHSSPRSPELWDYIITPDDAITAIHCFEEKICFIGHTHVPGIFSPGGRAKSISISEQHLVNVGSVGQPRDGNPMLAFGIFDSTAWNYELIRSEYDIECAADKILRAGLPRELGYRLMYGM
ncbi:MAG: metallophosphoesterase family protein [Bacteroidota bacterium]